MSAHSPGPWRRANVQGAAEAIYIQSASGRIVAAAVVGDDASTTDETAANARLLVAAPGLYAACAALAAVEDADEPGLWHISPLLDAARAAVAKAEGA